MQHATCVGLRPPCAYACVCLSVCLLLSVQVSIGSSGFGSGRVGVLEFCFFFSEGLCAFDMFSVPLTLHTYIRTYIVDG